MLENIAPVELDLADLDAEVHVTQALQLAGTMAGGLVGAGDLLLAATLSADRVSSVAFNTLRSLLPGKIKVGATDPRELASVRLTRGLGEAWNRYRAANDGRLWGRDLVTIAVLAEHDPTLLEFCFDTLMPVDDLQDRWFEFVTTDSARSDGPDFAAAWSEAGVPLPANRQSPTTAAYLVTASPETKGPPYQGVHVTELPSGSMGDVFGTVINRRHLNQGDRLFALAGDRGETQLVNVGTVRGSESDPGLIEQKVQNFLPQLQVDWLDPTASSVPVSHADLLAVDGEIATWSPKTTGLRLRPDQAAGFDAFVSGRAAAAAAANPGPPGSEIPEILHYAKTLSDLDHKNDWIGIRPDVEALSTLVAVNQVKPPLSVAIFGDWGSGKTFLLRKIQERVDVLAKLGQKTEALRKEAGETVDPDRPHYCSSILQIEFNAWHYTESNLWASLVNTIFEKIYDTLSADQHEVDKPVDELFKNFETARHARQAAEEETDRLGTELREAKTVTATATTAADQARDHLARTVARNVWTRLDEVIRCEGSKRPEQVEQLEKAFAHFGFEEALTSARTIDDTISRFQSVSGRAREVFGSLLATRSGLVGAVVVVGVVGATVVASSVFDVPISSVGTAIAASLAWLAERGATASKWLTKIESFSNWFAAEKQQTQSTQASEIESARADLELKQAALLAAQQRQQDAARHESRAKAELESITARDQMRRFVDERVTSRAYAQHLGLVSMIRSDFEELTRFMNRQEETEEIELVERIRATTQDDTIDRIPTIDRIVLYIDDLDRCQPDRVVEVLEAIHLLLAFQLFIVIVAVDPRWVLESLAQKYKHLNRVRPRNDSLTGTGSGYHTAATAHDYLEKIFHIPFWVRPMAPAAAEKLVEGFLDLGGREEESAAQRADRDAERFHSLESVGMEDLDGAPVANGGPAAPPDKPAGEQPDPAPTQLPPPAAMLKAEKDRRREQETVAAAAHIQTVVISEDEEAFIRLLSPYLGNSPRRVKRFANSYRLIKSGLSRAETARLSSGDDHRIVLSFLAVVTGAPNYAPGIFVEILKKRGNKLDPRGIADGLQEGDDPARQQEILSAKGALGMLDGVVISREQVEMWVPRVIRHAFRMIPGSLPIEGEAGA